MSLGIITYLDTVKGFKMDYSAISEGDTSQSYVFSSVGAIILGFERFWVWLGIITYLDTVKSFKSAFYDEIYVRAYVQSLVCWVSP